MVSPFQWILAGLGSDFSVDDADCVMLKWLDGGADMDVVRHTTRWLALASTLAIVAAGVAPQAAAGAMVASPSVAGPTAGARGLQNGDFESDQLDPWRDSSSETASVELGHRDQDGEAVLSPTSIGTARLAQTVSVAENTDYALGASVSNTGPTVMLGVKGHDGRWSQAEGPAADELSFRTGAGVNEIEVYLQAWKQQQGSTSVDNVGLWVAGEGPEPTPSPDPSESPVPVPTENPTPDPIPTVSSSPDPVGGSNLLPDGSFDQPDGQVWQDTSSVVGLAKIEAGDLTLTSSLDQIARVEQSVSVRPLTQYRLHLTRGEQPGPATAYVVVKGHAGRWSALETEDELTFTTGVGIEQVTVAVHAWKGQSGVARIAEVVLVEAAANQPEPDPSAPPQPQPTADPGPSAGPEPTTDPDPTPEPGANLVQNPGFEADLDSWIVARGNPTITAESDSGTAALQLIPGPGATVRVEQQVHGLAPESVYTLALQTKTEGADVWASYGIEAGAQVNKSNSVIAGEWAEKRFIFYTGTGSTSVKLCLQAYQTESVGRVWFDDVRILPGRLPIPESPGEPWALPPDTVSLPNPGADIIGNGDFDQGTTQWVVDQGTVTEGILKLQSTAGQTARAVQDTGILLAASRDYELIVRARSSSGAPTVGLISGDDHHHLAVAGAEFGDYSIRFRTTSEQRSAKILLERWKGDEGSLEVDSVYLRALGGEWLDTPTPIPVRTTETLVEEFDGALDPAKWLIVDRAWGGDNGGLVPENVSLVDGVLKLRAHGDQYRGDVVGHGDRTTRVGAGIATREYYASGKYLVRAKIPKELGAVSAFWSFHYLEKFPGEPGYWDEPSRIRNTEIDWEFPTDLSNGTMDDPISYENGRANTWGGKFGGEGAHHPGRVDFSKNIADGQFHDFGIEWHSGQNGEVPRVVWSLDGVEVYRHTGASFGQDNIPYRGARFWLGIWFPASGYSERIAGQRHDRVGWAGDPAFDSAVLEIDRVEITPFNEAADAWESETWPNGWYAEPGEYPSES